MKHKIKWGKPLLGRELVEEEIQTLLKILDKRAKGCNVFHIDLIPAEVKYIKENVENACLIEVSADTNTGIQQNLIYRYERRAVNMIKIFLNINRWYDDLKEPIRFFTAMAVIWIPIVIAGIISIPSGRDEIYTIFFCVWMIILVSMRMFWFIGNKT